MSAPQRQHRDRRSTSTRLFVQTVLPFYAQTTKKAGIARGQSGAVVALQRTSSDLRLNPISVIRQPPRGRALPAGIAFRFLLPPAMKDWLEGAERANG